LGAMGFALPAAVGAQLAKPDTCVLCVSGDGGFQMNIQELATVHRLALPIKMVIVDNKYLGMVRQWQQLFYERNYAETDLSDNPDFVEIAKAYKIHGWRLKEAAMAEFPVSSATADLLENFLRSPEPELLVFDCAPEANVYPMVPAGAALSEMVFEDE
jgi:acetolactate synthase-1/2/3 large subunit